MNSVHNRAVWFDIPVADLERATTFYKALFGLPVTVQTFGDFRFAVIDHKEGNGGCLVLKPNEVAADRGVLVYLNVNGRIRDAVEKVEEHGGTVLEPVHAIGPHGFRAIVLDSEGNRVALHSHGDE